MSNNICILFHCVCNDGAKIDGPHQELFVEKGAIKTLFDEMLSRGYVFSLPWDLKKDKNNCVVTFDDGYFNNAAFLEIGKEYNVPFILFINSFNIMTGKPFIWDIWEDKFTTEYPFGKANSKELYEQYGNEARYPRLENDLYRPFNLAELKDFAKQANVNLGLHSHHHQPLIRSQQSVWENEIDSNAQFFAQNGLQAVNELSLPCGLYTFGALHWAQKRFDRTYTINGGTFKAGAKVIDRISLVSPVTSGKSLMQQIDRSISPTFINRLKNKRNYLRRLKYAYLG